nr:hypothetical protein [Tanacetum cinerariifolium]
MSDSEHSLVIYTLVPNPVEDYSNIRSPEVDGPPSPDYVPGSKEPGQAALSLDYVPGLEEPEQEPPLPIYLPYVPELVYPEYMPPEDDVFPAEEQPFPIAATPTTNSPGYIPEFDLKGDMEEDYEEDQEEDPVDYPADSTVIALLAVDHVLSEEVTKPLPYIPSPPLPIPSPPLDSPTHIEIPESCLRLQKRMHFTSPIPSQEVGENSAAGAARQDEPVVARDDPYSLVREELYGFFDTVDVAPRRLMSRELDYGITDTWDELETNIMYGMMEDSQDDRSQLSSRVNILYRDRPVHRRLAVMIERKREARMAHKDWGLSMDSNDNAHSNFMSLHTTLVAQHALILDLQAVDRRRQGVIKELLAADHKRQGVTAALAARDKNRNGDDSHTSGTDRLVQGALERTYPNFLKCQPLNFKGTEGVVGLSQWFEKMKSIYNISNYIVACQVKFATCTLQGNALTWWNFHVKTTTPEAAHAMPWGTLKKMMIDKYCPKGEIKKLEFEMWNLKRGNVCFECGAQENFKKECPKLKNNNNRGNQVGNAKAQAKVYAVGKGGVNPDNNVVVGYPVFLANITTKTIKDKLEEKRLENVLIVRDFSEVFPDDLPGLLLTRHVEFQIDLVPGAAPVARAPYRLASSEMKEFEEPLSASKNRRFIRSASRVEYLLEDRPKAGLSSVESSGRRHSKDCF